MTALTDLLKPLICTEKTLLISCFECRLDSEITDDPNVINQSTLANLSCSRETTNEEVLKYHLEVSGCTRIIIIGDTRCRAIDQLLKMPSATSCLLRFQRKLRKILRNNHPNLLPMLSKKRMLVETNVLDRCRITHQFSLNKKKVEAKKLSIFGVIITSGSQGRIVFKNGIVLNNLISIN